MIDCFASKNSFWIDPQGHIRPCARYKEKTNHISTFESFSNITNSEPYIAIRNELQNNMWPKGCFRCKEDEEKGLHSKRQFYKDIGLESPNDFMIDISMGNYCNLKCRMCGPHNSTLWASDFKFLVEQNLFKDPGIDLSPYQLSDDDIVKLTNHIESIEGNIFLELKGGEPLIMPQTKLLIDKLVKLKNSKNASEVERADLIGRTTKYYSYVLIVEDEQQPELEGKIMVFPYGFKIKEKINLERTGENSEGKKCNVFDPANGKDLRLIVKEIGGFPNYDSSSFRAVSPLKIWDEGKKKFLPVPIEWSEEKQKNLISNAKVQGKVMEFLSNHDVLIEDNSPKRWTEEEKVKVDKIIEILSGKDITFAKNTISKSSSNISDKESLENSDTEDSDTEDLDEFFGNIDDE